MDLSIIIPVYNTSIDYIKECLESIKNAKISHDYEVIVINDGSTEENVISYLNEISEIHTTLFHKENEGVSAARNTGFQLAKGDFILCLDSDDIILPEINNAVRFLRKNKLIDVIYCDLETFGDVKYYYKKGEFSKFQHIYITNLITPSTALFTRKLTENFSFNKSLDYAEDHDFFGRIAAAGHEIKYVPKPFCLYRKIYSPQSLSQKNRNKKHETETFIKNQFDSHTEVSTKEVNQYILKNFKTSPKHLLKLILINYLPHIFNFLLKRKIYKNDIVID